MLIILLMFQLLVWRLPTIILPSDLAGLNYFILVFILTWIPTFGCIYFCIDIPKIVVTVVVDIPYIVLWLVLCGRVCWQTVVLYQLLICFVLLKLLWIVLLDLCFRYLVLLVIVLIHGLARIIGGLYWLLLFDLWILILCYL